MLELGTRGRSWSGIGAGWDGAPGVSRFCAGKARVALLVRNEDKLG